MMLALKLLGRGDLEIGHLNNLRMVRERSPKSRWWGAASRTLLPGEAFLEPLPKDFCDQVRPLATRA